MVNDSLVLIDSANTYRREGETPFEAVVKGAKKKVSTDFAHIIYDIPGLAPMILEKSVQAVF